MDLCSSYFFQIFKFLHFVFPSEPQVKKETKSGINFFYSLIDRAAIVFILDLKEAYHPPVEIYRVSQILIIFPTPLINMVLCY